MPGLDTGNHKLYYEEHGYGRPLIMIAGVGMSRLFWWKQVEPLAKSFRVITIDNRGIGNSVRTPDAFNIDDMAMDIAMLMDILSINPAIILGIGMGGFVALKLALNYPDSVDKLILVATSAGGARHRAPLDSALQVIINDEDCSRELYARRLYHAIISQEHARNHPEDLDRLIRNAADIELSPETYLFQLNAITEYTTSGGVDQHLDRISAPTLIIHGKIDPLIPWENGQYLANNIRQARLITYEGVGNLPPIEATQRFNEDIIAFAS